MCCHNRPGPNDSCITQCTFKLVWLSQCCLILSLGHLFVASITHLSKGWPSDKVRENCETNQLLCNHSEQCQWPSGDTHLLSWWSDHLHWTYIAIPEWSATYTWSLLSTAILHGDWSSPELCPSESNLNRNTFSLNTWTLQIATYSKPLQIYRIAT